VYYRRIVVVKNKRGKIARKVARAQKGKKSITKNPQPDGGDFFS